MNYQKHYELLCNRAKHRQLDRYTENHHIIPKCLGGDDSPENLVALTPEEHYVAHQLLVKIYPNHQGLNWAAIQMTGQSNGQRNNNKLYAWLKRKNIQHIQNMWADPEFRKMASKARSGEKNGSFGRSWYHHPKTLENKKCLPDEIPEGFIKGRKMKPDEPNSKCTICEQDTGSKSRKYCDKHLEIRRKEHLETMTLQAQQSKKAGGRRHTDKVVAQSILEHNYNLKAAAASLGYKTDPKLSGSTSHRFVRIKNALVSPRVPISTKG